MCCHIFESSLLFGFSIGIPNYIDNDKISDSLFASVDGFYLVLNNVKIIKYILLRKKDLFVKVDVNVSNMKGVVRLVN